jgi:large subunit ribosomal protein L25
MKTVSMSGSLRANVGKKDAKMNRANGLVPCVIYGGKEEIHFTLEQKVLETIIFTPYTFLIDLDIDGKKLTATLQDVQYHPVSGNTLHADFLQVTQGKPIVVSLPIRVEGSSPGVLRGGKLIKKFRKLKVKGLSEHMPEEIVINISKMEIEDSLRISDIKIPHIEILEVMGNLVISVASTRSVEPAAVPGAK